MLCSLIERLGRSPQDRLRVVDFVLHLFGPARGDLTWSSRCGDDWRIAVLRWRAFGTADCGDEGRISKAPSPTSESQRTNGFDIAGPVHARAAKERSHRRLDCEKRRLLWRDEDIGEVELGSGRERRSATVEEGM